MNEKKYCKTDLEYPLKKLGETEFKKMVNIISKKCPHGENIKDKNQCNKDCGDCYLDFILKKPQEEIKEDEVYKKKKTEYTEEEKIEAVTKMFVSYVKECIKSNNSCLEGEGFTLRFGDKHQSFNEKLFIDKIEDYFNEIDATYSMKKMNDYVVDISIKKK